MARSLCHIVSVDEAGLRLDQLLADCEGFSSRSAAVKAIEAGSVLVNGNPCSKKHSVQTGDTVVYELEEAPVRAGVVGQNIPLDIRFEDNHMIVLSKQLGLVCHPSVDHYDGTLVNALIYHCGVDHLCNCQGDDDRLGIVHRLDRDTTGLMLAAKTNDAGMKLMDDIAERTIDRHYLALVHGSIAHDTGMIDAPIARHASDRMRMAIRDVPSARDAITTFRVLERFEAGPTDDGFTLIDCKLFTGRTHQIRVHMEYAHHPLVGEPVYNKYVPKGSDRQFDLQRQFLHSFMLRFDHPVSGESMSFADNLPSDLALVLEQLADRSRGRTEAGGEVFQMLESCPHPCIEGTLYEA